MEPKVLSCPRAEHRAPLAQRFAGVMTKELQAMMRPKSEEKLQEFYTREEREACFAACETSRQRLVFGLALKLGLREREPMFLEGREFDFENKTVTIHSKTDEGFEIKDKAEQRINIVDACTRDGHRVGGRCFRSRWFGPLARVQTGMRDGKVFWWLICAAGRRIEVRRGFDAGTLERLLTILDRM